MKKLKKFERVENYLNELMQRDDFGLEQLAKLSYTAIIGVRELEGIGDRTISNVLNDFKAKKGVETNKQQKRKKDIVHDYISEKLENGELSVKQLMKLSYNDIKHEAELIDIGKTTITCALCDIKKQHDKKSFEIGVLDFLTQETRKTKRETTIRTKHQSENQRMREQDRLLDEVHRVNRSASTPNSLNRGNSGAQFIQEEIKLIRKMIAEFKNDRNFNEAKQAYELRELKHALKFVGINPHKLIRLYWKDVSKDFENQNAVAADYPMMQEQPSSHRLSL